LYPNFENNDTASYCNNVYVNYLLEISFFRGDDETLKVSFDIPKKILLLQRNGEREKEREREGERTSGRGNGSFISSGVTRLDFE